MAAVSAAAAGGAALCSLEGTECHVSSAGKEMQQPGFPLTCLASSPALRPRSARCPAVAASCFSFFRRRRSGGELLAGMKCCGCDFSFCWGVRVCVRACWDSISSSVKRGCGYVISGRSEAVNYESSEEPTHHVLVNCVGGDQKVSGVRLFVCLFL